MAVAMAARRFSQGLAVSSRWLMMNLGNGRWLTHRSLVCNHSPWNWPATQAHSAHCCRSIEDTMR